MVYLSAAEAVGILIQLKVLRNIGSGEAMAYLEDPILGPRLREVSEAILALPTDDAREVFGGIDSMKLRSSMTLFDAVAPADIFARVIDKYFRGRRDQRTLTLIAAATE